jgi:threonine synthase
MSSVQMQCTVCGATCELSQQYFCPRDNGELRIVYDYPAIRAQGTFRRESREKQETIERFAALLPLNRLDRVVSLGEGHTPLVRSRRLAERLGLRELYFKLESCNPTGSFKDRQMAVAISAASGWGRTRFATVSSGNAGVSLSAYCARAGMQAFVWVSEDTALPKRQQIQVYGARLFVFPGPKAHGVGAFRAFFNGLQDFALGNDIVPMVTARRVNPYIVEGSKTISFEIVEQLHRVPDRVFSPVGGGGLLGGLWKGFWELKAIGETDALPRMHGVQKSDYMASLPDVAAGRDLGAGESEPLDGLWAWSAIQESEGRHWSASAEELDAAQGLLAREEAIFAEPQGIYGAAGLLKAAAAGTLDPRETIVCIITGHGLKDMATAERFLADVSAYPPVAMVHSYADCREAVRT